MEDRKSQNNSPNKSFIQLSFELSKIALIFGFVYAMFFFWFSPIGNYSNVMLLRTLFYLRGEISAPDNIVIVAIDDLTYETFDKTINSRKYLAEAISKIHDSNPAIVILDIFFSQHADDGIDSKLVEALKKGPTVITKMDEDTRFLSEIEKHKRDEVKIKNDPRFDEAATLVISPMIYREFKIASYIGLPNSLKNNFKEQLPFRPALIAAGLTDVGEPSPNNLINFYGEPNAIPYVSMYEVLSGNLNFKDKIVFVGYKSQNYHGTVPGAYDIFSTSGSFFRDYFGVEVHATIAANLIDNSYIRRLSPNFERVIFSCFLGIPFLILMRSNPSRGLFYFCITLGLMFALTAWIFFAFKILLPGVFLIFAVSPLLLSVTWFLYGDRVAAENTRLKRELHALGNNPKDAT